MCIFNDEKHTFARYEGYSSFLSRSRKPNTRNKLFAVVRTTEVSLRSNNDFG